MGTEEALDDWVSEWQDVEPIPQDDGPRPAVPIAYSRQFKMAMGYLRAALARGERSPRSLRLTQRAIELNAANYTAWQFRRECLQALEAGTEGLEAELDYLDSLAEEHAKNYQLWHHRRWVASSIGRSAAERELQFSEEQLTEGDSKNYHIWAHRQWVLRDLGGATWQQELQFCGRLLEQDVWNNSAWNQRMFAFKFLLLGLGDDSPSKPPAIPDDVFRSEVDYTLNAIKLVPANESPWAYLQGFLDLCGKALHEVPTVLDVCEELMQRMAPGTPPSPPPVATTFVLSTLLEMLSSGCSPAAVAGAAGLGSGLPPLTKAEVGAALCDTLKAVDKMRANYWQMRKELLFN